VTDLNWIRIKIKQRQLSAEVSVRYLVSTTELSAINLRITGCASASKPSKVDLAALLQDVLAAHVADSVRIFTNSGAAAAELAQK
jgi:hypothetical protein